jgi:iron complex outermembrane receptor protein
MSIRKVTQGACISLCVCVSANAADNSRPEEVVVTAAPLDSLLQPTQVLTGDELLLKSAPTIGETLANEPGISSTYFGPASSRPVIRGLSGSRVSILTNSTSTLDVSDVSPDHAVTVESVLADQVEIIRGPATLLYGSNAAGGIVNVTDGRIPTAPAEQLVSGAVEARGDTAADEETYTGRLDGGYGNIAWHASGFDRETDNIEIPGFATADSAERPDKEKRGELRNSYSDSDGYNLGLSWVGSRGYLGASISELDSTYGLPGPAEEEAPPPGAPPEPELFEGPFLDLEQTRVDVRGELSFEDGFIESGKFALGINDYEHKEIEPSGEVATTFENDQWQARLEAQHAAVAGFRGAVGLQVDHRELESVGEEAFITATDTDAWGLFLFEEREADWGVVQFGGRIESLEHENDDFADYDDEALSVSAGVSVPVGFDNNLIFNLSRTERNPNAEELYSNGAHIATRQFEVGLIADSGDADKEVALNYELGLQRTTGVVTWEAWVYYYDYEDYVYQDLTGNEVDELAEAIYRQEDAEFYGTEAAVSFPLWQSGSIDNGLRIFGDYVKAELSGGEDLPRIPPWRVGTDFSFGQDAWQAGFDVIYHGEQNDVSSFETDDYTLVGANFLYKLDFERTQWELFVRGDNLLDKEARKSTSFIAAFAPLPGTNFTAGIRGRF